MTIRIPAEWEPHACCWMAWAVHPEWGKAALTTPVDHTKDQVAETRRILLEMNDNADRAIDEQVARSTPMAHKR